MIKRLQKTLSLSHFTREEEICATKENIALDLLILLSIAAVFRLVRSASMTLWADELFTIDWSQQDPRFLVGLGTRLETIPPLYYIIMHYWMQLFGASALSVRLPSVLFSTATIAIVYFMANELFYRRTALLAGFLAAINPFLVYYAYEARPYAFLAFFQGLALLSLTICFRESRDTIKQKWPYICFVLCASLGCYFHYTGIFFVVSCFVVIAMRKLTNGETTPKQLLLWALLAVLACLIVSVPMLQAKYLSHSADITWIQKPNWNSSLLFLVELFFFPTIEASHLFYFYLLGLTTIAVLGCLRLTLSRLQLTVLVVLPLTFLILISGVSMTRPILVSRVAIWLIVPVCILFARMALQQRSNLKLSAFIITLTIIWLLPTGHYIFDPHKENWRSAALVLNDKPACAGPIVEDPFGAFGLSYYDPSLRNREIYALPTMLGFNGNLNPSSTDTSVDYLATKLYHVQFLNLTSLSIVLSKNNNTALVLRAISPLFYMPHFFDRFPQPHFQFSTDGVSVKCF